MKTKTIYIEESICIEADDIFLLYFNEADYKKRA